MLWGDVVLNSDLFDISCRDAARSEARMRTSRSDPAAPRPADLVERNFNSSWQDALWVADFSSRADLARVRLRSARHRRLQPAGFSHALPGPKWIGVYLWALRP